MRTSSGNEERPPVVCCKFAAEGLAERGRGGAQIDRHIEKPAPHTADDLCLGRRQRLVVHAAQCQGMRVAAQPGLPDAELDARGCERVGIEQAMEVAALVAMQRRVRDVEACKTGRLEAHVSTLRISRVSGWR